MSMLVSRQAQGDSSPSDNLSPYRRRSLSERQEEAHAIAKAGNLIPEEYRNNPGAVMLAMDWAEAHDVTLFDTLGHVAFFGGKATVEARLQRQMAARNGYFTKVVDEGPEHCTVAVYDAAGNEHGRYTMTLDAAMKLDAYNRNKNWKKSPDQMLLARATTRALDRYATAPSLVGVFTDDDDLDRDPVAVVQDRADTGAEDPGGDAPSPPGQPADDDVVDAEIVDDEPEQLPLDDPITVAKLKGHIQAHGLRMADVIKHFGASHDVANLTAICDDQDLAAVVWAWVADAGVTEEPF